MRWIFNMDQTPLHFLYHSSRTCAGHQVRRRGRQRPSPSRPPATSSRR
jgi:hypothetical protein